MIKFTVLCCMGNVVMCFLLSPAAAANDYFYYYLGEPIYLTTTPNTLAVYDHAKGQEQDNALGVLFEDAQIEATQMKPHPIGAGWQTVTVPIDEASGLGGPSGLISTLINHDGAGRFFFSPVFLDPGGDPVIVPPEILVLFENGVSNSDVAQLLHQGGV